MGESCEGQRSSNLEEILEYTNYLIGIMKTKHGVKRKNIDYIEK